MPTLKYRIRGVPNAVKLMKASRNNLLKSEKGLNAIKRLLMKILSNAEREKA